MNAAGIPEPSSIQSQSPAPRVFLSYSHDSSEHRARVLALANRLRSDGIDAWLDRYTANPPEGWPRWLVERVETADFVLIVCSEIYLRRFLGHEETGQGVGVAFESILAQALYDAETLNSKFIPVVFSPADRLFIPTSLRGSTYHDLSTEEGFEALYRHLTGQPTNLAPPLGLRRSLPAPGPQPQDLRPNYPDEATRHLAEALENAYRRLEDVRALPQESASVRAEILHLRRQIREGGQLREGDFLLDGRFRLLEKIAQGYFTAVWKAYDRRDGYLVALKVLDEFHGGDRISRKRFFRGARAMSELAHPGIVRVFEERCTDSGFSFFAMEYPGGGDLEKAVATGRLSPVESLRIIVQVGEALQIAHQRGVIHSDIKPSNIMLDADGNPKLTDFGQMRAWNATDADPRGLNSFLYVDPVSLHAGGQADPASDIYSLGMTAIFALRGSLSVDILRVPDQVLATLPVNEGCRKAIARAVKWEPKERWPSVADFCQALSKESAACDHQRPAIGEVQAGFDSIKESLPWGGDLLRRLHQDGFKATQCLELETGRWLVRVRLPQSLSQLYGTAPEILHLVVADEVRGGDLRRAQQELHRFGFELDLDLLVVTDGKPDLSARLNRITQLWGQWVPWSSEVGGSFPSLAECLAICLPLNDVFERQDPVRGRQVIGRKETVADLSRRMLSGEAIGVFGLRKMGKTTAVRAVTDRLDPVSARLSLAPEDVLDLGRNQSSLLVAWLDCLRVHERSAELVAELLRRELEERCDYASLSIPRAELGKSAFNNLDSLLRAALKETRTPIGIVLDEYDLLFEGSASQSGVEGIAKLFGLLRAHAQESGKLSLVCIGRDPDFLERPEMEGRPNPMLQWFRPRWLGPMMPADAQELLQSLGRRVRLDIGENTAHLAREWTGGHPLLHRQFGSALLGLARDQGASVSPIPTDPLCEGAVGPFLDRGAVMTICREVFDLLSQRYPGAAQRLCGLCREPSHQAPTLIAAQGGWHQPATKILRNFGLLSGTRHEPDVPNIFRWYVETFAPELQRITALK